MKRLYSLLIFLIAPTVFFNAVASHIVGGVITYRCVSDNNYAIKIEIYQDCISGEPTAIEQDNPAYISIFEGNGRRVIFDSIRSGPSQRVPPNFRNDCINNPPLTCLNRVTFEKTYRLEPNTSGYYVVYQRCCRNATIRNIINPGNTGATYFTKIPPASELSCNNSAEFKNYPPQIICVNNPLVYDHAATDPDPQDVLTYELCESYSGGSSNDPKPIPVAPPYQTVNYQSPPFNAGYPMSSEPAIKIDPNTGLITGTPTMEGRYVVTVCCHEWRFGQIINTTKREFQFVVTNCSKAVVADIPILSDEPNTHVINCKDYTVNFKNNSTGGFSYKWDFGVNSATSTEFEPSFTYPDTGTYTVKLVVNSGSTCPDSIERLVKIYPTATADFTFNGLACPKSPIQFSDLSTATYMPYVKWDWQFGDGLSSTLQNPTHAYDIGGEYNVLLKATTVKGCMDTITKKVDVYRFAPDFPNDTAIVAGEYIYYNASGGDTYKWTPATNLNADNIRNPIGYYPGTGSFKYVVNIDNDYGCSAVDTFSVLVVGNASLFLPTAFTPNGDNRNDIFKPYTIGYRKLNYFRVFNRYGQEVFTTTELGIGWDGTFKGVPVETGTYYYVVNVTDRFGKEQMRKGDVTVVR